jgi:hypothetical protein
MIAPPVNSFPQLSHFIVLFMAYRVESISERALRSGSASESCARVLKNIKSNDFIM